MTTATGAETTVSTRDQQRDALVGRIFQSTLGVMDLLTIYIGDRLGFYSALAKEGPATSGLLAKRTGTRERYVREWLEQQAVTGILTVEGPGGSPADRIYALSSGHADVLTDPDSLASMAPLARIATVVAGGVGHVVEAFRTGKGVPYERFGPEGAAAQADANRPMYTNLLAQAWLPAIPEVHARLQGEPPAQVADVGCGAGWSSVVIASAYPNAHVYGFDSDSTSIDLARKNAMARGVAGRATFSVADAANLPDDRKYDVVTVFEALHDMPKPVEALKSIKRVLAPNGIVVVADERVQDEFTAPGDDIERLMYGASVLFCLPTGMAEQPSAATGTVMRTSVLKSYASAAGFRTVEVLAIQHDLWRFYRLAS